VETADCILALLGCVNKIKDRGPLLEFFLGKDAANLAAVACQRAAWFLEQGGEHERAAQTWKEAAGFHERLQRTDLACAASECAGRVYGGIACAKHGNKQFVGAAIACRWAMRAYAEAGNLERAASAFEHMAAAYIGAENLLQQRLAQTSTYEGVCKTQIGGALTIPGNVGKE